MKSSYRGTRIALLLSLLTLSGYEFRSSAGSTEKGMKNVTEWIMPSSAAAANTRPEIFDSILSEDRAAIEKLLNNGESLEVRDGFGVTPVLAAALIDDWSTVEYFLIRGADPSVADDEGFTLAFLSQKSRVDLDGRYGQALVRVRAMLSELHLLDTVLSPQQVRDLQQKGAWPPATKGR
ncbi:hypothetical protein [Rhizobium sp. CSW-27]|uniref:hypothetical protein n=1 Tax=Rhizobium sp. CSW-27 TaxID=2839985 RepID=UPI001C02F811|nr:hypothetical protein [Rhizobium sp. CSW-27]MBT9373067.1 hypothetical protein [Rhizobium sp. CSW-27]